MKRGVIIIGLFILLLGVCIVEEILLKQNLETLYNKSVNLLETVESVEDVNSSLVETKITEIKEFWNNTENYFCIVVNHINIEEAGEQLSKIETLSKQNKKEELIVEIKLLIYFAKSYEHIIVPSIQNIL